MLNWLTHWWHPQLSSADVQRSWESQCKRLLEQWFHLARTTGKPRGLSWVEYRVLPGYRLVRDRVTQHPVALVAVQLQFAPISGSVMEDVPQAREPRLAVAMFAMERGEWKTEGRAILNLTVEQVAQEKRFEPLQ